MTYHRHKSGLTTRGIPRSWRKENGPPPPRGRGEGVASVANKGLAGGHFGSVAMIRLSFRFLGSVANTVVSEILEEGRGRRGRGEKNRAAATHKVGRFEASFQRSGQAGLTGCRPFEVPFSAPFRGSEQRGKRGKQKPCPNRKTYYTTAVCQGGKESFVCPWGRVHQRESKFFPVIKA